MHVYSMSLVMPVYNEEDNIKRSVEVAHEVLSGLSAEFEIILVDDASTDNTSDILKQLKETYSNLHIVTHLENKKLGGALKSGFKIARNELVIYADADLPFDFHEIKKAVQVIQTVDADIIAAYRHDRTSDRWNRIVYTMVYNWMIRVIYRIRIRDVNFAFKVFKREILQSLDLQSEGSFINAEALAKATLRGHVICQIGVDYFVRQKGTSTLASLGVILKIIKELMFFYPRIQKFGKLDGQV